MKLIGLTGLPRSGKDTFAERLVTHHGFIRAAYATPLKQAAAVLLNREVWEMEGQHGFDREAVLPEWGFTTRRFLQYLGTEGLRHFQQDFWIQHMRNRLATVPAARVVITDCRFDNEAALVRELGGHIIEIRRDGCAASDHASDKGVAPDAVIYNDGVIADLWAAADKLGF